MESFHPQLHPAEQKDNKARKLRVYADGGKPVGGGKNENEKSGGSHNSFLVCLRATRRNQKGGGGRTKINGGHSPIAEAQSMP